MKNFSNSLDCLFTFLRVSFEAQIVFSFYHVQFISFITCAFGVISKKPLPNSRSQRFMPLFSSEGFKGLALTFISLLLLVYF